MTLFERGRERRRCSSYLHIIGRFLPNRARQSIIYVMAGGDGDFRVRGGDGSRLIMRNTVWREVIPAASGRDGICMKIYNN